MKCPNCLGEWTPPQNVSLSKCPFCQTDLIQSLNNQSEHLTPEVILRNMLQVYGMELLHNEQRLSAMISDLFANNPKYKKLLLLSAKEQVPQKMTALDASDQRYVKLKALQHYLQEEAFLHEDAASEIIHVWNLALCFEEPVALCFEETDESVEIVWERGFCGFRNSNGKMITPFKYDDAGKFSEGLAWVEFNDKSGFIDLTGKEVIQIKYDKIDPRFRDLDKYQPFCEGLAVVALNGKYGFIDKTGNEIIPFKYDDAYEFTEGLAAVKLNDKWGFIDNKGKEKIKIEYEEVWSFYEGLAVIKGSIHNPIDTSQEPIFDDEDPDFEEASYRYEYELDRFYQTWNYNKDQYGFIDKVGNEITPLKYDRTFLFSEGMALVELNGKHGFIDRTGKEVIPIKYDRSGGFAEGLASVSLNDRWGFIDKTGKEIVPLKYHFASSFSEGLAQVDLNGKRGFIDNSGNEIISLKYDEDGRIIKFNEGIAMVKLNYKYGLIDKSGNEVVPIQYDDYIDFYDGLAAVSFREGLDAYLDHKYGYIDKTGKIIIPFIYHHATSFIRGLAQVELNKRRGYIDKTGKEIIPLKYDETSDFVNGLAKVELNGKYGFIDYTGKEIIPLEYDYDIECWGFSEGLARVKLNDKYGNIDKQGNWINDENI